MPRVGITVYLPPDLEAQVLRVAKTRDLSASGIIASAVKALFADNPNGVPEGVSRQLARIESRLNKVTRDVDILKEALLLYVRVWVAHNPPIDEGAQDMNADSDEARFQLYLTYLRDGLEPHASVAGDWERRLGEPLAETSR